MSVPNIGTDLFFLVQICMCRNISKHVQKIFLAPAFAYACNNRQYLTKTASMLKVPNIGTDIFFLANKSTSRNISKHVQMILDGV